MSETRFKKLIVLSAVLGCAVCAAAAAVPELTILIFKLPCGFFVDLLWELAMTGDGWRIFAIALISMWASLAKLLLIELSRDNNVNVSLPLFPLLFCLAALIVSRFIAAHKQLRDDNDLFV